MADSPRIGFLGLGIMGSRMAARLVAAGFPVSVFNRDPAKCAPLVAAGAQAARTPREAALDAKVILAVVADDRASRAVWLGDDGALASAGGAVCIESSTITAAWARELAAAAAAKNCEFLDAPVTGSKTQAGSGELNFLVGGDAGALEKVRPVLAAMGKRIFSVGPVGSGALLKLVNNFLCGVQIASLAEAMALLDRSGVDHAKAMEILTGGAPASPLVKTISNRVAAGDYTPNFALALMGKDLRYAIAEAGERSLELPTALAALGEFQKAVAAGYGEKDIAALVEWLLAVARGRL